MSDVTARVAAWVERDGVVSCTVYFHLHGWFPWTDGGDFFDFQGKRAAGGAMVWRREGGGPVTGELEQWLNAQHRHRETWGG